MKKRLVLLSVLVLGFFMIAAVLSGPALAAKKEVVLRLVVPSPAGDYPLTYVNTELAKRFNERAKGEYKIEVYAGGALAKLPEYFDAVRVGAVEMACAPWAMFTNMDPRLGVIETPFLFESSPAASSACADLLPPYDEILRNKFNAKGLGLYNSGGVNLFSTRPVKTLEDWQGLLVGCLSPVASGLAKSLGAAPVTVMWTETYEVLQKKVIDSALQGTHGAVVMNNIDVAKNAILFYGVAGWNGFSINLDVWKKMPEHIRKILQEEAVTSAEWMSRTTDTEVADLDLKAFKDKGVDVYFVPADERARWKTKAMPFIEEQLNRVGEFGQKVKQIAEKENQAHPYTPGKGF